MGIKNFNVRVHDFQIIKLQNNIALAKCKCCRQARFAVFIAKKDSREFYYHGFDKEYAEKLFNYLISKSQVK